MRSLVARTALAAVLGVAASLAFAHHSFAMFDQTKQVTVIGKVADVQWTNPHVWIFLDGAPAGGKTERWGVEFTSKVHLTRRNFTSDLVKVGDNVLFTSWAGDEYKANRGEEILIMREEDILAVIDG